MRAIHSVLQVMLCTCASDGPKHATSMESFDQGQWFGLFVLGKTMKFLLLTDRRHARQEEFALLGGLRALGRCLHMCVQPHSKERLRASAELFGTSEARM